MKPIIGYIYMYETDYRIYIYMYETDYSTEKTIKKTKRIIAPNR